MQIGLIVTCLAFAGFAGLIGWRRTASRQRRVLPLEDPPYSGLSREERSRKRRRGRMVAAAIYAISGVAVGLLLALVIRR